MLDAVKNEVARVNDDLPEGMELVTSGDDSLYIRAAINEIYYTIGITTALVGFVIFVFLGSIRATLIPLVTIPVCLIATFSVLAAFGYSINLVTLLALALSIGLVVDDAIVVLENAHRRIELGEAPLLAAFNGTRQVAFAVIATTVVLVSVFAPVAFLRDSIGRVFAELAVTIAAAVTFSMVLALSLSPMMCSKLLRSSTTESRLTHALDKAFERLSSRYQALLRASLRAPWASVVACAAIAFGAYFLLQNIPQEYAPVEDRGQFNGQLQAPEGTSYERLRDSAMMVEAALQPYFDDGTIQRGVISVPGWGNQSGIVNVTLKPWGERTIETQDLLDILNRQWEEIPDIRVNAFISGGNRGSGGGGGSPVQIVLGGPNYEELARWRDIIIARASENPGLVRFDSDLRETQPQVLVRAKLVEITYSGSLEWGFEAAYMAPGDTFFRGGSAVFNPESYLSATTARPFQGGSFNFAFVGDSALNYGNLNEAIRLLKSRGRAEILGEPNILATQGVKAVINAGEEVPIQTAYVSASAVTTSISFRRTGITLEITPELIGRDAVRMRLKETVAAVSGFVTGQGGVQNPVFNDRSAETTLTVRDGATLVVGGLQSSRVIENESGIPLLMDIPVLGWLFSTRSKDEVQTELYFIATPEIIFVSPDAPAAEVAQLMRTEGIHRVLVGTKQRLEGILTAFDLLRAV